VTRRLRPAGTATAPASQRVTVQPLESWSLRNAAAVGHLPAAKPLRSARPEHRLGFVKTPRSDLLSDACSILSGYDRCWARGTAAASLLDERAADQPRHHYRVPPSGGPCLDPVGGRRGGTRHGARDRLDPTHRQGPLGNPTAHPRGLGLGWRGRTCVAPSTQSGQEPASTEVQAVKVPRVPTQGG